MALYRGATAKKLSVLDCNSIVWPQAVKNREGKAWLRKTWLSEGKARRRADEQWNGKAQRRGDSQRNGNAGKGSGRLRRGVDSKSWAKAKERHDEVTTRNGIAKQAAAQ